MICGGTNKSNTPSAIEIQNKIRQRWEEPTYLRDMGADLQQLSILWPLMQLLNDSDCIGDTIARISIKTTRLGSSGLLLHLTFYSREIGLSVCLSELHLRTILTAE